MQLNSLIKFCFDPRGRAERLPYLTAYVWCVALLFLPYFLQESIYFGFPTNVIENSLFISMFNLLLVGLYALPTIVLAIVTIKRFHDIKMSGFAILFLMVPFLNIYYQLVLFSRKGPSPFSETFLREYGF